MINTSLIEALQKQAHLNFFVSKIRFFLLRFKWKYKLNKAD